MHRRTLLLGVAGSTGLTGCSGILGGSSDGGSDAAGSNRTPEATVEAFYDAALSGDANAARSYFHPEAELAPPRDAAVQQIAASTLRLENATLLDRTRSSANVRVTVSEEAAFGEDRITNTIRFELRPADGEWLLYAKPLPGPGPTRPTVTWEFEAESTDDGAIAALTATHVAGDTLDADQLAVEVGDATVGPGSAAGELTAGDALEVPFDAGDSGVAAGTTVEIRWTADVAGPIGAYALESPTTGQPASTFAIET